MYPPYAFIKSAYPEPYFWKCFGGLGRNCVRQFLNGNSVYWPFRMPSPSRDTPIYQICAHQSEICQIYPSLHNSIFRHSTVSLAVSSVLILTIFSFLPFFFLFRPSSLCLLFSSFRPWSFFFSFLQYAAPNIQLQAAQRRYPPYLNSLALLEKRSGHL